MGCEEVAYPVLVGQALQYISAFSYFEERHRQPHKLDEKLFSSDRFMRIERCSSSQPRTNSVAVRPTIIVSSPSSISHISLNDEFLMPASTMACVRNGINSCIRQATDRPEKNLNKVPAVFFINKFNMILHKIEEYTKKGIEPTGKQGQTIAKEFWQLITEFTGGDMSLLPQLMNFRNMQTDDEQYINMQITLNNFIEPALNAYFTNSGTNPFENKNE